MSLAYRSPATIWSAQSLDATVTSDPILAVGSMSLASVQLDTTSTGGPLTGTFVVQVSNDPLARDKSTAASASWTTIQSISISGTANNVVSWFNSHLAARIKFTNASGTGTGTAYLYGTSA